MIENWEDAAFETDGRVTTFRTAHKEFCNSSFRWRFGEMEDGGVSIGKTLPAIPTEESVVSAGSLFFDFEADGGEDGGGCRRAF